MTDNGVYIGYPAIPFQAVERTNNSLTFDSDFKQGNYIYGERYLRGKLATASAGLKRLNYDLGASSTSTANYLAILRADRLRGQNVKKVILRGGSQSAFKPSSISGLSLWLDSTRNVTANASNEVSQWDDLSGNNYNAIQGTTTNKPHWSRADNKGNALTYSQAIATGGWSASAATRTNNYATNYDGTSTAARLLASAGSSTHIISGTKPPFVPANKSYTLSIYLKYSTNQYVWFGDQNDASWRGCNIDVQNGTIQNTTNLSSSSIVSAGSGWYLVTISFTRTNTDWPTTGIYLSISGATTGSGTSFAAAGTEDVLIGNVSMIDQAWDTSHIVTTDAPAFPGVNGNRTLLFDGSDDYLTCNGASAVTTGNDTPFSLFFVFKPYTGAANSYFWSVGNSGSSNKYCSCCVTPTNNFRAEKADDTGASVSATASTTAAPTLRYYSVVFSGTAISVWDNAVNIKNAAAFDVGTMTNDRMTIGALGRSGYGSYSNGHICEVILYNSALGTTDRQAIENYLSTKWTGTSLIASQTFDTETLYGPDSNDYISTFTTSSAYRHWWLDFDTNDNSSTTNIDHSKHYFGPYFDMGRPPVEWEPERLPARQADFYGDSGSEERRRVDDPIYRYKFKWEGVTDAIKTDFFNKIVRYKDRHKYILFTTAQHQLLDNQRIIHCKLTDVSSDKSSHKADYNTIEATFEQVHG